MNCPMENFCVSKYDNRCKVCNLGISLIEMEKIVAQIVKDILDCLPDFLPTLKNDDKKEEH